MSTVANLADRLNSRHPAGRRLPPVLLMTDARRLPDPLPAVRRLRPGDGVVLRHYESPERVRLAHALGALCRRRGLRLLIAEDWRLALRVGAAGVHLPERGAHKARWCRRKPGWLVTATAHSRAAVLRAAGNGADAVLLAPVFATQSHPETRPIGALRFAGLVRAAPVPVYALGGITRATGRRLAGSGAVGIAAISALVPTRRPDRE